MTRGGLQSVRCGLVALLLAAGCSSKPASEAAQEPGATVREGATVSLHLSPESVRHAGIRLARVTPSTLAPEVQAYGRVLEGAPVGEAVVRWRAAKAASRAAESELARVRTLAKGDQNASRRQLEAARASNARARADRERAEARVIALLGPSLAKDPHLVVLAHEIAQREAALVRVDVPGGGPRPDPARGAHLRAYPERRRELRARYVGPAPDVDPSLPGIGFLFIVEKDPPPVGTPVSARLRVRGEPKRGVDVPAEALVRGVGGLFVFVAGGPGDFERRRVEAQARDRGRWFVDDGLAAGEQIVVSGAQEILSAERLGAEGGEVKGEEDDD